MREHDLNSEATQNRNSDFGIYLGQIAPPLLLLPLFNTPWDNPMFIYWVFCGFAAVISVFTLLFNAIRRPGAQDGELDAAHAQLFEWRKDLRPILTITIFAVAVFVATLVTRFTIYYKNEVVGQLQRTCKEQGKCPSVPAGWNAAHGAANYSYGHWRFLYFTNEAQNEFNLIVLKGYENSLCIHGGSGIELVERQSISCPMELDAPISDFHEKT